MTKNSEEKIEFGSAIRSKKGVFERISRVIDLSICWVTVPLENEKRKPIRKSLIFRYERLFELTRYLDFHGSPQMSNQILNICMAFRNILFSSSVLPLYSVELQATIKMEFKNLHNGTTCKCIDNKCKVNTEDFFYRRLFSNALTKSDFKTWDEIGKKNRNSTPSCDEVCSYKSLSLSKEVPDVNIEEFYKTTIRIKPNTERETPYYCRIKFTSKCGKVKLTPSKKDPNHHSFYKADDFDFEKLILVEIKPMPK